MTGSFFPSYPPTSNGLTPDQLKMLQFWQAQSQQMQNQHCQMQFQQYPMQQHFPQAQTFSAAHQSFSPASREAQRDQVLEPVKSAQDLPHAMNAGSAKDFPSMGDLAKDTASGGRSGTVQDNEVSILDPSGRAINNFVRYSTFEETPFPESLKASLSRAGFPAPSQIQQYTWPLAMQQRDTIGVAATGSGKTLAFLLPAFAYILERRIPSDDPALLVLAPTRELAIQIDEEARKFGKPSGIRTTCCYGGAPKHEQLADLRSGTHSLIGTPGRINDFLEAGQVRLDKVVKLVLDEADRMLDMGFEPQIRKILAKVPRQRHSLFFTATWPPSIRRLASEFLSEPYRVQIGNRDELKGNQDITQIIKPCNMGNKNTILMQVLQQAGVADRSNSAGKGIVFCGTKRMCDQLADQLRRNGVPCASIHGDKGQREREQALGDLRSARIKLLVATDVAARGLDVKGITIVVNYDVPSNTEDYVHRIGRTGRAGQKGYAVALITDRDAHALRGIIQVMKRTNQEVPEEVQRMASNAGPPPPSGRELRMGKGGSFGGKGKGKSGSSGGSYSSYPDSRGMHTGGRDCSRSRSRDRRRNRSRSRRRRSDSR